MVDISVLSRSGQILGAGSDTALFLKVFSGEVLTVFNDAVVMKDLVTMRSIQSGKSAQFPAAGRAISVYHVPGENLLDSTAAPEYLSNILHNERIVTIDDLLLSATFIDSLDEAKNHYDVRQIYAGQLGHALADEMDERLLRVAVLAARDTTPTITGEPAGEAIVDADFNTDGPSAIATLYSIAQKFDEKNVPDDGDRHVAVEPQAYYTLAQQTDLVNKDINRGDNGSFSDATVMRAAGINIVKTNNLPRTNFTAPGGEGDASTGNFTTNLAVAFHRSALATVKLRDLTMESEYLIEYQGNLMVAKFAMGHNYLRPEAAIEVASA